MYSLKPHVEQTDPPRPASETLPTMYDLLAKIPEEPGLPDEIPLSTAPFAECYFCNSPPTPQTKCSALGI